MSNEMIIAILSSSILTALFTSIITGWFDVLLKNKEYQNDYFKEVIKRRIEAYGYIDTQISVLKISAYDETDSKIYHLVFAYSEEDFYDFQKNLGSALSKGIWINTQTKEILSDLSSVFLKVTSEFDPKTHLVEGGKKYYEEIVSIRNRLENTFCKDMAELHDVKKFLKIKSKEVNSIQLVEIPKRKKINDK